MRIRKKPWAEEELRQCVFFTDQPALFYGHWQEKFARRQPLYLELGCGKGGFISQIAPIHPHINFLAVDIKDAMLGLAVRKTAAAYAAVGRIPDNVWICAQDIERIDQMLSPIDTVSRIYINFCNPWPRTRHHKKRLTHTRQLIKYSQFMPDGEIHFKTDDRLLFQATKRYLQQTGFLIRYETDDLHNSGYEPNYETEHEKMFSDAGLSIFFLIAEKKKEVGPEKQQMTL